MTFSKNRLNAFIAAWRGGNIRLTLSTVRRVAVSILGSIHQTFLQPNQKRMKEDSPLKVEVLDGQLVVSIGVETLRFSRNQAEKDHSDKRGVGTGYLVTDPYGFARDVVLELVKEREDGSTILTDVLDRATLDAIENGSIHTEEH